MNGYRESFAEILSSIGTQHDALVLTRIAIALDERFPGYMVASEGNEAYWVVGEDFSSHQLDTLREVVAYIRGMNHGGIQ